MLEDLRKIAAIEPPAAGRTLEEMGFVLAFRFRADVLTDELATVHAD